MTKTALIITPDYVSHFNPLIPIGEAFRTAGYRVVVAAGDALEERIRHDGFEHVTLVLGEESNAGLIRPDRRAQLRRSLLATRRGWIPTLMEQAEGRVGAFLWHCDEVADETLRIMDELQPTCVIVVQLAFAAVAALLAIKAPFATFVTGHPTQLPTSDELYGYPYNVPSVLTASSRELDELYSRCQDVQEVFTDTFNRLMHRIDAAATPLQNGLAAASPDLILFNYPSPLMTDRAALFPQARCIGASVRTEPADPSLQDWLEKREPNRPTAYFSFGSYFSVHSDILRRVACALSREGFRAAFATGLTEPTELGRIPEDWLTRTYFSQVGAIRGCDVVICHGGNNTVTEALEAGVPVVVAPFASDQFDSAASVETHHLGAVFNPNTASTDEIQRAIREALQAANRTADLGLQLRSADGPQQAFIACERLLCD